LQKAGGATFEEIRDRMAKYIVGGLLMMPVEASPGAARDAILAVVQASSPADHDIIAAGFARRGFGSCAISPAPESQDFVGIVESTVVAGRVLAGAETTEATQTCDDDAVLDAGETMRITVPISNRGHLALTNLTATLTSTTEGVTVTSAPSTIASLAPYATAQITADIALVAGGEVPVAGDFALTITADGGCTESTTLPIALRLNVDDVAESSATDTFDTAASVWTPAGDALPAWSHVRDSALDGAWHAADLGTRSDTSLVSPVLTVGEGPLSIAFQHRHDFELAGGVAFDGAVIEYTTDSGTTWQDISTLASPGYSATLDPNNALGARMAYTGKNPSHPLVDTVTLDLGTQLAGAQMQLRFRVGTDGGAGAPGWDLDDVVLTGIVGTPFPAQVADDGSCGGDPDPDAADGGCCDAGPIGAGNLAAALGVLGLVLRRRRRGAR
nr:peptidase [Myxococcota bacterium]